MSAPAVAAERVGTAARLGTPGITLPPALNRGESQVSGMTRQAARSLHQVHRQKSKHTRKKKLSDAERKDRSRRARAERWFRRHELRDITTLKSVKRCGVAPIPVVDGTSGEKVAGPVSLRVSSIPDGGRTAGYGGLQHCGSVWACPVCSATVATRRAQDLAKMLRWALEQGYSASMMTLTLRHFKGQRLRDVWSAVSAGWKAATGGKQWVNEQADYGLEGWVKAVEATHGANGWHVHLHVLLIWDRPEHEAVKWRQAVEQSQRALGLWEEDGAAATTVLEDAKALGAAMHRRWTQAVRRKGFDSIADSGGLDVRMASLDPDANGLHEYFTKMAFEVAGGYAKEANGKGRAPFQILADAFATGLADDFDLWWEWEEGSRGRRQMAWSKGLRDRAALGAELTDEESANQEMPADEAIKLTPKTHAKLSRDPWASTLLLEVAEDGGLDAACAWLDERNLGWYDRRTLPRQVVG